MSVLVTLKPSNCSAGSSWVGLKAVPPLLLEACQGADASQGHGEFRQADGKGANWRGLWGGPLGGLGGSSSAQAITAVAVHPVSGLVIAQTEVGAHHSLQGHWFR